MTKKFEQQSVSAKEEIKQKRIKRLKEQYEFTKRILKEVDDIDFEVEPVQYNLKERGVIFSVVEGEDGYVSMKIESDGGEVINFEDFLPKDHKIIGNLVTSCDENYMGLGGSGSMYLDDKKEIIINEKELKKDGWEYIYTFLHEAGHAIFDERFPSLAQEFHAPVPLESEFWYEKFDYNVFLKNAMLQAQNEANACYIGVDLFEELLENKSFLKDIFKDKNSIEKNYKSLLYSKAKWLVENIEEEASENEKISEQTKNFLIKKIFEMYEYNPHNKVSKKQK